MRVYFELVRKETLHLLRDKRMLMMALLIPVVQMIAFGFAISTEVNNVDVAVAFDEYSEGVRQQIDKLAHNPYITLVGRVGVTEMESVLRKGKTNAVVYWKNEDNVQVVLDSSNPNLSQTAANYIQSILKESEMAKGSSFLTIHLLYNPLLKSSYNFVPGIMGMIFLLICAMMTAVSIVREKETGTIEVLFVSPVRPLTVIMSKMVPYLMLSCIILGIILLIAYYLLGVPMSSGVFPIVFVSFIYIILALALGLLVSTISKTQVTASLISGMVMIMPVMMLSGMIFPIDNLPIVLREISCLVPARWYVDATRKLMIQGLPLLKVMDDVLVLLGMAFVFIVVALKNFNDRLE